MRFARIAGAVCRNVGDPILQINIIECGSAVASPGLNPANVNW